MSQGEILFLKSGEYLKENHGKRSQHYKLDRIVMQGITGVNERTRLRMMLAEAGTFCANSVNYIVLDDPTIENEYILGIMNSTLLNFLFSKTSTNSNVNGYEVDNLPIKLAAPPVRKTVVGLVRQIPCGEDFRVTLGAEEKARVAREIDQQVKQSLTRATSELWLRLMQSVAHLAAQLERPKARLHTSTLRNVTEIADLVPRLNVTNDEELTALAQETNSRLASFTRQELAEHPAARARAAGIANELAAKIKHAMKDRGYDSSNESAAIGQVSGMVEAPMAAVQMTDPNPTDPAPQPAPAPEADQIVLRMQDYMELMAS
jgi:hypothetical protein